jgi:hypothetical protein
VYEPVFDLANCAKTLDAVLFQFQVLVPPFKKQKAAPRWSGFLFGKTLRKSFKKGLTLGIYGV